MARRPAPVVLGLLVALAAPAGAHVFWPTFHSAKSAVALDQDGLRAAVVLEVPTFELVASFKEHYAELDLMAEIEGGRFEALEDEFRDFQLERFAAVLTLEVDGAEAAGSWQPVDTPMNGKGSEGFFVYMLEFVFDRPPQLDDRVAVRLINRAFPDEEVVMANVAEAEGGWEVAESSIPPLEEYPDLPEGAVAYEEELGQWSIDDAKRDLRVVFARSSGPAR